MNIRVEKRPPAVGTANGSHMPHQRRYFPSGRPYFITNRVCEGLPFVANLYVNLMLFGIIARAWFRHRASITICAFLFLANHYHMMLVLKGDPSELTSFMNYVDGEIAKLVVRWLGKRNYKVWARPYSSPILLDSESAFEYMAYLFANPVEAHLCATAATWTGCSTYYALEDSRPRAYKWIRPSQTPELPNGRFTKKLQRVLVRMISEAAAPSYLLEIKPFAWMECFAETKNKPEEEMRARLYRQLQHRAEYRARERLALKRDIADPVLLAEQNPHRRYKPSKRSPRVFCLSSCEELRKAFIALYKELCFRAEEAWHEALETFKVPRMPHGMFAPPIPPRGSVISIPGFF